MSNTFVWDEQKQLSMKKHYMETVLMTENNSNIDFSDIPEIKDLSKAIKNPYAGKFTNGYTVIVEHEDFNEISIRFRHISKNEFCNQGGNHV